MIDVDDLKTVNDTWGHDASEAVLTAVARVLRDQSRPGDVLIRCGGDEFLLLLAHPGPWPPSELLALSVSIGVCAGPRTQLPVAQLDAALYTVKRARKGHAGIYS
jgi:GGDEF domain-containing protein